MACTKTLQLELGVRATDMILQLVLGAVANSILSANFRKCTQDPHREFRFLWMSFLALEKEVKVLQMEQ